MHLTLIYNLVEDYLDRRPPLRGEHLALARAFVDADPYVRNGLVASWEIRKWNVVVGDGTPA